MPSNDPNSSRFQFNKQGLWWKIPLAFAGITVGFYGLTDSVSKAGSDTPVLTEQSKPAERQVEEAKPIVFACDGPEAERAIKNALPQGLDIMGFRNHKAVFQNDDTLICQAEVLSNNGLLKLHYKFAWFDEGKTQSYVEVRQEDFREELMPMLADSWDKVWEWQKSHAVYKSLTEPNQAAEEAMFTIYTNDPLIVRYWTSHPQEQDALVQEIKQMVKEKMQQERDKLRGPVKDMTSNSQSDCMPVFSCTTENDKRLAVCSQNDVLVYSFGKPDASPEMTLQTEARSIHDAGNESHATFANGRTTYDVFWPKDKASSGGGVKVNLPNGQDVLVACKP